MDIQTPENIGEKNLAEDTEKSQAMAMAAKATTAEQLEMNQLLGRLQATTAVSEMLETLSLAKLQQIKNEKSYKQLEGQTVQSGGETIKLDTWSGFCQGVGLTRQVVDEKLQNLQMLGEHALDRATALGMTTRELRKLRKLDEADQNIIIGEIEANVGDKESVVELIETMSVKHAKDKASLEQQLDDVKADSKATDRVIADKDKKINDLTKQLAKQESRTLDDERKVCFHDLGIAEIDCLSPLTGIETLLSAARDFNDPRLTQRSAAFLFNVRNAVDDLLREFELEFVDLNQEIDDSWAQ